MQLKDLTTTIVLLLRVFELYYQFLYNSIKKLKNFMSFNPSNPEEENFLKMSNSE